MTEQTLRPYNPSWADKLAAHLYDMTSKSPEARNFVGGLMGGTGLGRTGMGLVDATPLGVPLGVQESYNNGDAKGMALAAIPMPMKAGAGMVKRAAEEVAGGMARAPYQRKLSPQGLYSWGAEAAYNLPQENMTVQQARSMLEKAGTKPDEFHWSGFNDAFPDPNTKVSRDQLVKHFETNAPRLGETTYGVIPKDKMDKARAEYAAAEYGDTWQNLPSENRRRVDDLIMERRSGAKFSGYTLPGGDNYREVLTTLPRKEKTIPEVEAELGFTRPLTNEQQNEVTRHWRQYTPESADFTSSHWDEPNVLAHLRLSDRTDAGGNKLLHMEESQSDWGQAARKKGITGIPVAPTDDEVREFFGLADHANPADFRDEMMNHRDFKPKGTVPNAPYIGSTGNKSATGWTDLNLKRALWEAAQNDADALAWTPGADQAARYDLSTQLHSVHYEPDTNNLLAVGKYGNVVKDIEVPPEKLADYIGKEAAERLLATQPQQRGNTIRHILEGDDLALGGRGMRAYYDRTIPTQLGAVMKRAGIEGGEMGTANIFPEGIDLIDAETQPKQLPALRLTPAMREQIKKGLPYFAGAPVGFGMMQPGDEQR